MEKEDKKYYEEEIGSMIECMATLKPEKDENGNYKTKERKNAYSFMSYNW